MQRTARWQASPPCICVSFVILIKNTVRHSHKQRKMSNIPLLGRRGPPETLCHCAAVPSGRPCRRSPGTWSTATSSNRWSHSGARQATSNKLFKSQPGHRKDNGKMTIAVLPTRAPFHKFFWSQVGAIIIFGVANQRPSFKARTTSWNVYSWASQPLFQVRMLWSEEFLPEHEPAFKAPACVRRRQPHTECIVTWPSSGRPQSRRRLPLSSYKPIALQTTMKRYTSTYPAMHVAWNSSWMNVSFDVSFGSLHTFANRLNATKLRQSPLSGPEANQPSRSPMKAQADLFASLIELTVSTKKTQNCRSRKWTKRVLCQQRCPQHRPDKG